MWKVGLCIVLVICWVKFMLLLCMVMVVGRFWVIFLVNDGLVIMVSGMFGLRILCVILCRKCFELGLKFLVVYVMFVVVGCSGVSVCMVLLNVCEGIMIRI